MKDFLAALTPIIIIAIICIAICFSMKSCFDSKIKCIQETKDVAGCSKAFR